MLLKHFALRNFARALKIHALRFAQPMAPRAENPYGTHVPILLGIGRLTKVQRVAEFGCGHYSTLTFLDESAFPSIEQVHSFETDAYWRDQILVASHDPRLRITLVNGAMNGVIGQLDFAQYEIVLVDDSSDLLSRAETIRAVARSYARNNVLVFHDFEVDHYRRAAKSIRKQFVFSGLNPNTGVAWEGDTLAARHLRRLAVLIARYRRSIAPQDRRGWIAAFDAHPEVWLN